MRIVLVSDSHLSPVVGAFGDNWLAIEAWIASMRPDMVVHLGDITAYGDEDPAELSQAFHVLNSGDWEKRFLPGNHDMGDNPPGPGVASEQRLVDLEHLQRYRGVFGPDRWSFRAGAWQILGLNAQLFGTGLDEEEAQFAWVEAALGTSSGPLGVMLHKPLFRNGPADDEIHGRYVPQAPRRRLLDLLARRDLRFVVAGHTHQTRQIEVDGVEHVWAPSCAFVIPDALQETIGAKIVGAMTLDLTDTTHHFRLALPDRVIQHNVVDFPQLYPEFTAKFIAERDQLPRP